jgi:hypothetical protein
MYSIWTWGWGVLMLAVIFLVSGVLLLAGAIALRWLIEQGKAHETDAECSEDKKQAA